MKISLIMEKLIVGIGEALWDCLPKGRKIGGAPANFAYHAGKFGFKSLAISAVGKDSLGDELEANLEMFGLDYKFARVDYPTGTVQVHVDELGNAQYEIRENVAWDNIPWTPELEQIANNCQAVCFGSLAQRSAVSRDTINRFIDAMPSDSFRIFDVNLRQNFYTKEVLRESLEKCNILKINDQELEKLREIFNINEGMLQKEVCKKFLTRFNLKIVVLTCGTSGSYVYSELGNSFVPTPEVRVADTIGAGDSFIAAFVSSLLQGDSIRDAHIRAANVAAFVCTRPGAMPAMPEDLVRRKRFVKVSEEKILKSGKYYSEDSFWHKIVDIVKKAGSKVVYAALLLYYVLQDPDCPNKNKSLIIGALGYLILPLDLIPDFIPLMGFSDDLAALVVVIKTVYSSITPAVRSKARIKMTEWFRKEEIPEI